MSLNMHGAQYGLSQHNKILQNVENVKMQRKMGQFALYSIALATSVTHVDDLHQACCNRSTAYVLQSHVL